MARDKNGNFISNKTSMGTNSFSTPSAGLTANPNYSIFNSAKDAYGNFAGNTGGLGTAGTYSYPASISSTTGLAIPGGSIGVDQGAYGAIQNPDVSGAMGGTGFDMGGVAAGIGAAANLANAYIGYKQYGLAKEKFGFEKAATNRSIANQASEYNTGIQNAGEVGMGLAGNTMDPNARAARQAQLDTQKISGLAIG